ncbi:hypothetical protein [Streptomyces demainii]|uniref:MarR family transcriptional regulator n=1 Tax=Streptomyces demainii TaxID=588122 RepID=A0ABT9KWQ4_9ACTN|nr:hypothetical protein [Streptomyces demainii]MDP9612868.1 hypothetical protein [Streptomyces demainii]
MHTPSDRTSFLVDEQQCGDQCQQLVFPPDRVSVPRQRDTIAGAILRGGSGLGPVTTSQAAEMVGVRTDTASECMRWGGSVKLLVRTSRSTYAATRDGWTFTQLWSTDQVQARLLLNRCMRDSLITRKALQVLADGPMHQDALAKRLHQGQPGKARRGIYAVEWLVLGLVLERDHEGHVSAPETHHGRDRHGTRVPPPAASSRLTHTELFYGMTAEEMERLSDDQYERVLANLTEAFKSTRLLSTQH